MQTAQKEQTQTRPLYKITTEELLGKPDRLFPMEKGERLSGATYQSSRQRGRETIPALTDATWGHKLWVYFFNGRPAAIVQSGYWREEARAVLEASAGIPLGVFRESNLAPLTFGLASAYSIEIEVEE